MLLNNETKKIYVKIVSSWLKHMKSFFNQHSRRDQCHLETNVSFFISIHVETNVT